jgi:hypothetical protein
VAVTAPWSGPARPGPVAGGSPAGARLPSAASVGKTMLASFDAATGDVLYEQQIGFHHGEVVDEYRDWFWPGQPAPGQQGWERETYAQIGPRPAKRLPLVEDWGVVYSAPVTAKTTITLTMVCYAAEGCGYGNTQTPGGTWSRVSLRQPPETSGLGPGGLFNPAVLAQQIAEGQWRIMGRTRLDGQPTIELNETPSGDLEPLPEHLWLNARTYLPLLCTSPVDSQEFAYLPPTRANLALLAVPIPRGFPRSDPLSG